MLLQIVGILLAAGLAMWAVLRFIAGAPALLTDVKACRGHWAEARLRHCEGGLAVTGIPVEPINTFSNLAYLAAAWILFKDFGTLPATVVAASLTLLFVGSSLYHGTKTKWGARLDHAGIYAVFGSLAIYCVAPAHPAAPYIMLVGAAVFAIGFALVDPGDLNARMGLLLGLVSIRGFLLGRTLLSAVSLGFFLVAFAVWFLDLRTTVLWRFGHAIWHVCTAAAIVVMFGAVAG
jgi:predicted membrane channel-forming protein YqfA (hemolysin III family)